MEENINVVEKPKKRIVLKMLLMLIIGILLGGGAWYLIDSNIIKKDDDNKTNDTKEVKEEKLESLDVNSELVTNLLSYIPGKNMVFDTIKLNEERSIYLDKKVTISDMKDAVILYTVVNNGLSNKGRIYDDETMEVYEEGYVDENGSTICDWCAYSGELVQNKVRELYGDFSKVDNQDFSYYEESCRYSEAKDYYYCENGGGGPRPDNITKVYKAEESDDAIYIYEKYLFLSNDWDEDDITILSRTLWDNILMQNKIDSWNKEEDTKTTEEIMTKYESQASLYKHTFKKNKDGNYYYYSTEPIKE